MSVRREQMLGATGKMHWRFVGSFTPSGAGVSTASGANRGRNFTPSHTGTTGIYRITLLDDLGATLPFVRLIAANFTFQSENAYTTPTFVSGGAVSETGGTLDIIVWAESAGTLAKANVTASGVLRRINFDVIVAMDDIPGDGASA